MRGEAARTYLSFAWWVIEPVLLMMIYYFVFALLLERNTQDFVPFLLVGLIVWQWFANSVSHSCNAILRHHNILTNFALPMLIFPIASLIVDSYKFLLVLGILTIFLLIYGYSISAAYLFLPVVIITQALLISGTGLISALITTILPDFGLLIPYMLRFAMYASGVFYAVDLVPTEYQVYFYYNPMSILIEQYRSILMLHQGPDLGSLAILMCASLILVLVAYALSSALKNTLTRALLKQ